MPVERIVDHVQGRDLMLGQGEGLRIPFLETRLMDAGTSPPRRRKAQVLKEPGEPEVLGGQLRRRERVVQRKKRQEGS